MNTIHPLVLEVRRLASSLSSNLVRQHIEHIDFDAYAKEFESIQGKFEAESSFEKILDHEGFAEELRAAVSERINNLRELRVGALINSASTQSGSPSRSVPEQNLRSNLKRQILNLDALDCRLSQILAKIDQLKTKHKCTFSCKPSPSPNSLSDLWKQLSLLESTLSSPINSESQHSPRKPSHSSTSSYLLSLYAHYDKWQKAMHKCLSNIETTIRKLIQLKPRQEQLFAKNEITEEGFKSRKSMLTEIMKKKTMETDSQLMRQVTIPDSDFQLERPERRRKKQRRTQKSPSLCARQCAIF